MLDRAGATAPTACSISKATSGVRKRMLDFATGSGGFLVEAARRIVDVVARRRGQRRRRRA